MIRHFFDPAAAADVQLPRVTRRVAARRILRDNLLSGTIPLRQFLYAGIFDRSVGVPGQMKWEEQPIIVVQEPRIDVVPDVCRFAAQLRALVGNLQRIARLVLPLIGDLVGLGFPSP